MPYHFGKIEIVHIYYHCNKNKHLLANVNTSAEDNQITYTADISCPLWRRLAAIVYDSLLLSIVVLLAWQPVPLLPDDLYPALGRALRLAYLTTICFLFFGWFWCHGGQTLGMRSWRIRLVTDLPNQSASTFYAITWRVAWMRFISAILSWSAVGMGFIWSLFHHDKLTWHDIFSHTRLIVVKKD